MITTFKIGDIVLLRGGGPLMTVCWVYQSTEPKVDKDIPNEKFVKCMWFNVDTLLCESKFNTDTLVKG